MPIRSPLAIVIAVVSALGCSSSDPPPEDCGPCQAKVIVPETPAGCMLRGVCFDDWYCQPIPGCQP